ncbi:YitT family protein [Filobacillus milosensis]|uniref:YitT family protein n=1 Tax=Filobacillus milosensis TaxID=94137 RepID=A0A4Y8INX3_9BACI|nr:YitT family protein [Filobacillus milosensis]TFB22084.1 YitT family protein [Filobacillus milosensis]
MVTRHNGRVPVWQQLLYIVVGSAIVAFSYNGFLLPNYIAAGGVSGISTITQALFGLEPAYVIWGINIPVLLCAFYLLGRASAFRSVAGSLILPFFVFITRNMEPISGEIILASVFGGIGVGVGLGIVYLGDASTGGTSLIAQMIYKYSNLSLGASLAIIDGVIVLTAILVFDVELGLFALIGLFMTSKSIDFVQTGFSRSKATLIVSGMHREVQQAIYEKVDRGVTRISAQGGFTEQDRPVLMCVVNQTEIGKLKRTIKEADPDAFVIVMDSSEVLGTGFYQTS